MRLIGAVVFAAVSPGVLHRDLATGSLSFPKEKEGYWKDEFERVFHEVIKLGSKPGSLRFTSSGSL